MKLNLKSVVEELTILRLLAKDKLEAYHETINALEESGFDSTALSYVVNEHLNPGFLEEQILDCKTKLAQLEAAREKYIELF